MRLECGCVYTWPLAAPCAHSVPGIPASCCSTHRALSFLGPQGALCLQCPPAARPLHGSPRAARCMLLPGTGCANGMVHVCSCYTLSCERMGLPSPRSVTWPPAGGGASGNHRCVTWSERGCSAGAGVAEGERGTGPGAARGSGWSRSGCRRARPGEEELCRTVLRLWRSGLSPGLRKGFSLESRGFFKWC